MYKLLLTILIISCTPAAWASWLNIRNSAVTADNTVFIRFETDTDHILSYYERETWIDLPSHNIREKTYECDLPFDNTQQQPLSFKTVKDDRVFIIPGIIDTEEPVYRSGMNQINKHEKDDNIPAHLNISSESVIINGDDIIFALQNFGDGFEVKDNLFGPYYSYSVNLWYDEPQEPEYVYSLIYTVDFPPFISKGLYRIKAEDESREKIAGIETRIDEADNTLYLSCKLQDLFGAGNWLSSGDGKEKVYINSLTQKIEDFGDNITIYHETVPSRLVRQDLTLHTFDNSIPQIKDVSLSTEQGQTVISLNYYDKEGHFPIIAKLITDKDKHYTFKPKTVDFTGTVVYTCRFEDDWSSGTVIFSDNGIDKVKKQLRVTDATKHEISPSTAAGIYPNPFYLNNRAASDLIIELHAKRKGQLKIELFNLKGQRVYIHEESISSPGNIISSIPSTGLNSQVNNSGIYFLRAAIAGQVYPGKLLIVK